MSMMDLTPTQAEAISRRKAFRATIERRAAELAARKARQANVEFDRHITPPIQSLAPEAFPAEPDPPGCVSRMIWPAFVSPMEESRGYAPRVSEIQAAVCHYYEYPTIIDLKSYNRTLPFVGPRHVAMYLTKSLTDHSYPQIGRFFGGRDHSSVLHAIRKIGARIKTDEKLAFDVASLFELITGVQQ